MRKWVIGAVIVLTALTGLTVTGAGAGQAQAKYTQDVPRAGVYGDVLHTMGSNANCRGGVHVILKKNPRKPGWLQVSFRSAGFTGDGAAWRRSPVCKVTLRFAWFDGKPGFYHEKYFNLKATRARGPLLAQKVIHVGQGVNFMNVTSTNLVSHWLSWYTIM